MGAAMSLALVVKVKGVGMSLALDAKVNSHEDGSMLLDAKVKGAGMSLPLDTNAKDVVMSLALVAKALSFILSHADGAGAAPPLERESLL